MNAVALVSIAAAALGFAAESHAATSFEQIAELPVPEAYQGVGVDDRYFYAVDNQSIAKYDKATGKLVKKWQGQSDGTIVHLDGAMRKAPAFAGCAALDELCSIGRPLDVLLRRAGCDHRRRLPLLAHPSARDGHALHDDVDGNPGHWHGLVALAHDARNARAAASYTS